MRHLILTPLLLLVLPALAFADRDQIDRRIDKTLPAAATGTLRIDNEDGDIRVTVGTGSEITITAWQRFPRTGTEAKADALARDLVFKIEPSATGLILTANHARTSGILGSFRDSPVEVDWIVTVPAAWSIDATATKESDVELDRIAGPVRVRVADGDITLRNVTGAATLETFDGDIDVVGVKASVTATTGNGDIEIQAAPADTFRFNAEAPRGQVDADDLNALAIESGTRGGKTLKGTVGTVTTDSPRLHLRATKGDIELETR